MRFKNPIYQKRYQFFPVSISGEFRVRRPITRCLAVVISLLLAMLLATGPVAAMTFPELNPKAQQAVVDSCVILNFSRHSDQYHSCVKREVALVASLDPVEFEPRATATGKLLLAQATQTEDTLGTVVTTHGATAVSKSPRVISKPQIAEDLQATPDSAVQNGNSPSGDTSQNNNTQNTAGEPGFLQGLIQQLPENLRVQLEEFTGTGADSSNDTLVKKIALPAIGIILILLLLPFLIGGLIRKAMRGTAYTEPPIPESERQARLEELELDELDFSREETTSGNGVKSEAALLAKAESPATTLAESSTEKPAENSTASMVEDTIEPVATNRAHPADSIEPTPADLVADSVTDSVTDSVQTRWKTRWLSQ